MNGISFCRSTYFKFPPWWKRHGGLGIHHPQRCCNRAPCKPGKVVYLKVFSWMFGGSRYSFPSYLFPRPLGRLLIQLPQFVDQGSPSGVRYWWNIIVVVLWKSHLNLLRSSNYFTSSLCRSSASDILWDTGMVKLSRSRSHVKSENI